MNKSELIRSLAHRTGLTQSDAKKAVDALFDPEKGLIVNEVRVGGKVSLTGFGTFSKTDRAARTGVNPSTGAPISISASSSLAFKAGKSVKETLTGRN
jgi:DNA-binding protein HU-beta